MNIFEWYETPLLIFLYTCIIYIDSLSHYLSPFFVLQSISWLKFFILGSEHSLFLNADESAIDLVNYNMVIGDKVEFTLLSLIFWFFVVMSVLVLKRCLKLYLEFRFSNLSGLLTSKYLVIVLCVLFTVFFDFQSFFSQIATTSRQEVFGNWTPFVRILSVLPIFSLLGRSYKFGLIDFLLYLGCVVTIYFVSLSRFYLILSIMSYVIIAWSHLKIGMRVFVISIASLGIFYISILGTLRQELIFSQDIANLEYTDLCENVIKNNFENKEKDRSILGISAYGQFLINTESVVYGYGYLPVLMAPIPSFLLPFKKVSSLGEVLLKKNGFNTGIPLSAYVEARLNFGYFFFFGAFLVSIFYYFAGVLVFEFKFLNIFFIILILEPNVISLVSFLQFILLIAIISKIHVRFHN